MQLGDVPTRQRVVVAGGNGESWTSWGGGLRCRNGPGAIKGLDILSLKAGSGVSVDRGDRKFHSRRDCHKPIISA